MRKLNSVSASAMGYAISFLLLIGLICSGVLFVASANKRLERNYSVQEHLVFDNYFSLLYGAKQENGTYFLNHPAGDSSTICVKNWGVFNVVEVRTHHRQNELIKTALIGKTFPVDPKTVYLPEMRSALKICGDTKLEGTISISEKGIERAFIAGKVYTNKELVNGTTVVSDRSLPALNPAFRNVTTASFYDETIALDGIPKDSVFSFSNKTSLVQDYSAITINQSLTGNIVVQSFDSIFVSNEAKLDFVILIAPRIRFESGFRGNVQALASESIVCEQNVQLNYPSVLILNETKQNLGKPAEIVVLKDSRVLGGILMESQFPDFRKPVQLRILNGLVGGFVYNQGSTEVQGKIIGYVYTYQFGLKAGGGEYVNHLLDATISSTQLPKTFVYPNWIAERSKYQSQLLAWF